MLKKIAIALSAAALLLSADDAFARNDCYAWGQARPIISKEGLLPLRDVRQDVKNRYGGQLIRAKLCERAGSYVYDVTVLGPQGQVTEVTVNGRTGAFLQISGGGQAAAASAAGAPKSKKGFFPKFKLPKFWKKKDQ